MERELEEILIKRIIIFDFLRRAYFWEFPTELFIEAINYAKRANGMNTNVMPEKLFFEYNQIADSKTILEIYHEIKIEYTRLFVGPRHLPSPPYASVYMDKNRLMMQQETLDVRQAYLNDGLRILNFNQEPDDHIGTEMEFMYVLNHKAIDAFRNNDKVALSEVVSTQIHFSKEHMVNWIPNFCDDILQSSKNSFWKNVAIFTKQVIQEDVNNLMIIKSSI